MATIEYEGAIENINEQQLKFIGEVLENKGFKNRKVKIDVVGAAGDNYVAHVKRFTVTDRDSKTFKIIAKIAPGMEQHRILTTTAQSFQNEHVMYTAVLPKFKNLQISAGVPKEDIIRFADYYGSNMKQPNEVILLEDLNVSDFVMLDRFKSFSNDCMLSILKHIAIIHSLSFVLKQKEPDAFEQFRHKLYDILLSRSAMPEVYHFYKGISEQIVSLVSDDERRARVLKEAAVGKLIIYFVEISKADAKSKHNVIQQGDIWTNNILFKLDGEALQESIFIDYQLSRIANPVNDLMFMIFSCTDHQTRLKHYYNWIDYYHTELEKALSYFDIKASNVYPKDQLNLDLKRYAKYMFALCVVTARIYTLNSEDVANLTEDTKENIDMGDISEKLMTVNDITNFKHRVEGLIDSFVDFNLL